LLVLFKEKLKMKDILTKIKAWLSPSKIDKALQVKTPLDLKSVWENSKWDKLNSVFTLYNYNDFRLLDPLKEEEIIVKSEGVTYDLKHSKSIVKKAIVFAEACHPDIKQNLFYGFDEKDKNLGIWVWLQDNGPNFPSKLSNNLEQIFESEEKMINGFELMGENLINWIESTDRKEKDSDFNYGNFPRKDLQVIAEEICPDIIYFPNASTFVVDDEIKNLIAEFYSDNGRTGLFDEIDHVNLPGFLDDINLEDFNQEKESKIFVIYFYNNPTCGLCKCNKKQAAELNRFGYLHFSNHRDSVQGSKFINE